MYGSNNLKHYSPRERWNLIVGNPPHSDEAVLPAKFAPHNGGRQLHREFFRDAGRFLAPNGVSAGRKTIRDRRPMIEAAALKLVPVED